MRKTERMTENLQTSPRAGGVPTSWLNETFRLAEEIERRDGRPVAKLHVGEPFFTPPAEVAEALTAAMADGRTQYAAVEGLLGLREALIDKVDRENGVHCEPHRMFVTPGSCQGLSALLRSLAGPGAEILLPEVHWPVHLQQALLAGLRPVFYPLDEHFLPSAAGIRELITDRTRVLLVNSPANPTGAVTGAALLQEILDVARSAELDVVSDEAYEDFVYDSEHISMGRLEANLPPHERIVNSVFTFSKCLAMTGMRLGYVAVASDRVARVMRVVQEANIIATSTPVQYAGIAALGVRTAAVRRNRELLRSNRDRFIAPLQDDGMLTGPVSGGWYAMLDISATGLESEEFSRRLLAETRTCVVPGSGFALRPRFDDRGDITGVTSTARSGKLVRVAFCVAPDVLAEGTERLRRTTSVLAGVS